MEIISTGQKVKAELKKKRKWEWLLISLAIFLTLKSTKIDEAHLYTRILYFLSLGLAPIFYYWIRSKIKIIKNKRIKNFVVGLVVVFIFIFAISFINILENGMTSKTSEVSNQKIRATFLIAMNEVEIWHQNWQKRWNMARKNIVDDTDSQLGYSDNISGYKFLQELNAERYNKMKETLDIDTKFLTFFSNYDMGSMYRVNENQNKYYDELFKAKVDYFQSLLDKESATQVEARRLIVSEKKEKIVIVENEAQAVLADYNKILEKVFNNSR